MYISMITLRLLKHYGDKEAASLIQEAHIANMMLPKGMRAIVECKSNFLQLVAKSEKDLHSFSWPEIAGIHLGER